LGNPLKSEGAAFKWLVAVLAGAAVVILVAVLMSSTAAALLGFILLAMVSVVIIRGMAHMLGSPDGDLSPDPVDEGDGVDEDVAESGVDSDDEPGRDPQA
jgi:membrane protein implicated in regulation of membrane protease activity